MLVLTRKQQEKIYIGGQVTITIVRIQGNTVRVGIEAPEDVRIIRGELSPAETVGPTGSEPEVATEAREREHVTKDGKDTSEYTASPGVLAARVRSQAAKRQKRRTDPAPLNAI
jgi:carbon storage regulator